MTNDLSAFSMPKATIVAVEANRHISVDIISPTTLDLKCIEIK